MHVCRKHLASSHNPRTSRKQRSSRSPLTRFPEDAILPLMPSKSDLLDLQFIEARHKLIDLAAFLDRIDRHPGPTDYRLDALQSALLILLENRNDRARAVLEAFSDPSTDPIPKATVQGATGAPLPKH